MIKEHFQLLQGLVDRGRAGQIEIHYNTNGTQYGQSKAKQFGNILNMLKLRLALMM
jgi:hypothetical protein